jgi:hypothetical protein
MYLIDVQTYRLVEFMGEDIPWHKYAILSHTWGPEEVSFQDMQNLTDEIKKKKGFEKIRYTCEQAIADGLEVAWVDTCCIDKRSSADLSEAVNSMFQWYERSFICYVYFSDVPEADCASPATVATALKQSRWFTRGWTLQELLAPQRLEFYSQAWELIAVSNSELAEVTGIPYNVLERDKPVEDCSVAQRMSWASKRNCTRVEDIAYCLLGIFQVNMPLLYGEGEKAFMRLQEEIMRANDDDSILAWTVPEEGLRNLMPIGVMAPSPAYFAKSSNIRHFHDENGEPPSMSAYGLRMDLPLQPIKLGMTDRLYWREDYCETFLAWLNCKTDRVRIALFVLKVPQTPEKVRRGNHFYWRLCTTRHITSSQESMTILDPHVPHDKQRVYLKQQIPRQVVTLWNAIRNLYIYNLNMDFGGEGHEPTWHYKHSAMSKSEVGSYVITGVDANTMRGFDTTFCFFPRPRRISVFVAQSSAGYDPFAVVIGLESRPERVFCHLLPAASEADEIAKSYSRAMEDEDTEVPLVLSMDDLSDGGTIEPSSQPFWTPVSEPGPVAQSTLLVQDIRIRASLFLEDPAWCGPFDSGYPGDKKCYILSFTFENLGPTDLDANGVRIGALGKRRRTHVCTACHCQNEAAASDEGFY